MPKKPRTGARTVKRRDPYGAVLDAAAAILEEDGYGAFTIEAVARRSGAGKTTVYRRWATKAELFIDLYQRQSETLLPVGDLGSLEAELNAEVTRIQAFWRTTANGPAFRALIAEAQADTATLALVRSQFLPRAREFARAILKRAEARGEIDAGVDIETAVDLLFGFAISKLIVDDLNDSTGRIAEAVALLVRGVAKRPPAGAEKPREPGQFQSTRYVSSR